MKKIIYTVVLIILTTACEKSSTTEPIPTTTEPIPTASLKDIDGNVYDTIKIGSQFWMKQNLKTTHYRNGDIIPHVTASTEWAALTSGAWCWYNNDSAAYAATYGRLYNWFAINDPRGLAPEGWHLPSSGEYILLSAELGGDSQSGGKLKEPGITHWSTPNTGATNSSRFTGLPGGFRAFHGAFYGLGTSAYWWSSTNDGAVAARNLNLVYNLGSSTLDAANVRYGFSVRCLKN